MEIKCQLDATEVFIADLIACSTCFWHHYAHHPELKSIIQWLLPVVFRAVVFKLLVWCGTEGYSPLPPGQWRVITETFKLFMFHYVSEYFVRVNDITGDISCCVLSDSRYLVQIPFVNR